MRPGFRVLTSLLLVALLLGPGTLTLARTSSPRPAASPLPRSRGAGGVRAAPLDVVINEVAWMGTQFDANDEWLELYNNTAAPIDLTGWTLRAADGTPNITLAGVIPAHGYFLLERTDDTTIPDIPADQIYSGALGNTGEALTLCDAAANIVDTANGDGGAWPAGDNTTKQTMERIDPLAPDTDANWGNNTRWIRNGHDNGGNPLNGTPKTRNSLSWPDVALSKQAPPSVVIGAPLSYQIQVVNQGPLAAPGVLITDTLPAGFLYDSYASPYPCALTGGYLFTCEAGEIAPAGEGYVTINGSVALTASGTLLNQVYATAAITEITGTNNLAQAATVVQLAYPDLAAHKAGPATVAPDSPITYTLAISSIGALNAPAVRVTDTLPAGVAFVDAAPFPDLQPAPGILVWTVGDLPTGDQVQIVLYGAVRPTATGVLTNVVVASTAASETNLFDNTAVWRTTVHRLGTGVVINEVAWAGHSGYTSDEWIELYNKTDAAVDLAGWTLRAADGIPAITLTGVIPAHGYYLLERDDDNTVSDIPADQIYTGVLGNTGEALMLRDAGGNVMDTANGDGGDWPAGTASPNYQSMERIRADQPDADANWASNDMVTRNGLDAGGNPINGTPKQRNSATPPPAADLVVGKAGPATVAPGDPLAYVLTIKNDGDLTATAVRITDTLPAGVVFAAQSSPFTFTLAGNLLLWEAGSLAPAAQATWIVTGAVALTAVGTLRNQVYATTAVTEVTTTNNLAWVDTLVEAHAPDLAVEKTGPDAANAGGLIQYVLTVQNLGDQDAPAVVVTDTLPAGVAFLSSSYTSTQVGPDVIWALGTVTAGGAVAIDLYGQILLTATGVVTNAVVAATSAAEPYLGNNAASWDTAILPPGTGHVVVNEVAWAGTGPSPLDVDEWIELYNPASTAIDLTGWTLAAADGTPYIVLNGTIPAHGYFLLERTDDTTVADIPADQIYSGAMANTGEALMLRDAGGQVVDTANGDGGAWPAGTASPNYQSMERIRADQPDSDANWASNDMVHRNGENAQGGPINGTPKQRNSATPPPSADLTVAKQGPLTVTTGMTITYSLAVTSHGELDAAGVRVTDTLPLGVAYLSQSSPYPCTPQGRQVVCVVGPLPIGAAALITLVGQVEDTAPGVVTNRVAATTVTTETLLLDNTAAWTTTVKFGGSRVYLPLLFKHYFRRVAINEVAWAGTAADANDEWIELVNLSTFAVDLTGWTLQAQDGQPAIALAGVIPAGGYFLLERSDDSTVSDIPADQIYAGGLANTGEALLLRDAGGALLDVANGAGGDWPAGTASPNYQSMERLYPLQAEQAGAWRSNDMVWRNGHDANGNPINGTPRAPNSFYQGPDLAVAKIGPEKAAVEGPITYVLTLENVGGGPAAGVVLADALPAGVTFVAQDSPYSYTQQGPQVIWTVGPLDPAAETAIVVHGYVEPTAPTTLTNVVTATAANSESNRLNNTASWATTVERTGVRMAVESVLYDGYQANDGDEAVRLVNTGSAIVNLAGWQLCKETTSGLSCLTLPALVVSPTAGVWLTADAAAFALSFGFAPDYQLSPWLSGGLSNTGDEVILRDPGGVIADVVIYGNSPYTGPGWAGPALVPYRGSGAFATTGQILQRILDEATGRPIPDTDTAADWFQYTGDYDQGCRVLYPGWDLPQFFRPLVATEVASVTVAVAPDHAAEAFLQALSRATVSIEAEIYELRQYTVTMLLAQKASQGVRVTVLLEGEPAGGLQDQEKWACQQITNAGGACWFMFNEHDDPGEYIYDRYTFVHSKMALIDRQWVVISSQNPTASGMPGDDKRDGTWGSRGVLLITNAPSVVARAGEIFDADLDPAHHNDLTRWAPDNPYGYGDPPPGFTPIIASGGTTSTVAFPAPLSVYGQIGFELLSSPESSLRRSDSLLGLVGRAGPGDRVRVEQMYEYKNWATPTDPSAPNLRLAAYIAAARRGASVRILLNSGAFGLDYADISSNADALKYLNNLAYCEGLDLQARLGNPTGYGIHNKMVLVWAGGQGYSHIGSINGSETSSKINREVAVQVASNDIYSYLEGVFEWDWAAAAYLLVSEALYNAEGDDAGKEWVEIYNPTDQPVDLTGWMIGDALNLGEYGSGRYYFPNGTVIPAHGLLTIAQLAQMVPFVPNLEFVTDPNLNDPTVSDMVKVTNWDGFGFALSNEGDEVILQDPTGKAVDVVVYGAGYYPGVFPYFQDVAAGHSIQRDPPERDTEYCSADLFDTQVPTPGQFPVGYHDCGDR